MRKTHIILAALAVSAAALTMGIAVKAQTSESVWDGVYTDAQAARGGDAFSANCAICHGASLGGSGEAPALVGPQFVSDFDGQTMGDVFDRIKTTMPQTAPGSLKATQYADILSFLLKSNGFPAGQGELDRRSEYLKAISFDASKPK